MSNTRWIKARDIQKGDTILFTVSFNIYQVKVAEVHGHREDIVITMNTGQKHKLKAWHDVRVLDEQKD